MRYLVLALVLLLGIPAGALGYERRAPLQTVPAIQLQHARDAHTVQVADAERTATPQRRAKPRRTQPGARAANPSQSARLGAAPAAPRYARAGKPAAASPVVTRPAAVATSPAAVAPPPAPADDEEDGDDDDRHTDSSEDAGDD